MGRRKSFLLRISPELHRALELWARDELRSLNAQIEFLLRRAVQARQGGPKDPPDRPPTGDVERPD